MLLCLLVFVKFSAFSEEKTINLGGKNGWSANIQSMENLTLGKGRYGQEALQISTSSHKITDYTDLYISFEDMNFSSIQDETGNYKIEEDNLFFTENSIVGSLAGLSRGKGSLLVLSGKKGSLFGELGLTGSFKIEFWLNPAVCAIYLKSSSTIVPEKWARHSICYDDENGTLEYYIDGILEGIAYTTDTGNAYGQYLIPDLGTPAKIEICRSFVGSIDELLISREVDDVSQTADSGVYSVDGAYFESLPLDTNSNGSVLNSVDSIMNVPEQTEVQIFVRASDNFYEWNDVFPKWTLIKNKKPESLVQGRYFQVAINLFTDGKGEKTPVVTSLDINYSVQNPPYAPDKIFSQSGDSEITISWNQNNPNDKYGYLVYYGTKPGEYVGQGANQGDSPIDCGNKNSITITGLKNGRLYYFAVATYLKDYPDIIGPLSKEIYDRPLSEEGKNGRF